MELTKGNLAIIDHAKQGKALYVFDILGKGQGQKYIGEYTYANHEWRRGPDRHGDDRKIVIFNLLPVGKGLDIDDLSGGEDLSDASLSLDNLRKRALAATELRSEGDKSSARRNVYRRTRLIAKYVLKRSGGNCESCKNPAPFLKANGSPYLEPHHVNRLSDGGLDHPRYMGAICPACHREIHRGLNGKAKNEALKTYVARIEPKS